MKVLCNVPDKETCIAAEKEKHEIGWSNFAAVVAAARAAIVESCTAAENRRPSTARLSPKTRMVGNRRSGTSWLGR